MFGCRHQPDADLGDDAEVGLGEQAVQIRADAPLIEIRGFGVWIVSKPGAQDVTRRDHDLHSTLSEKVVAVWADAEAPLERVAKDAASGTRTGRTQRERDLARLKVLVELPLRHPGFDDGVREL